MNFSAQNAAYFGAGYYHAYRRDLLPAAQTEAEAAALLRLLKPRPGARWLDVPCGFGRHLLALRALRPALPLCGIDRSRAYLQEPGLRCAAEVAQADMLRLPYRREAFSAVLCLLNSFGYFGNSGGDRSTGDRAVLREFARGPRPGGSLVLDLPNRTAQLRLVREQPRIRYGVGDWQADERFKWDAVAQCLCNETTWRWQNKTERARYRLRLYTPAQIKALLAREGFAIESLHGDFRGAPFSGDSDRMLIVARRAAELAG